MAGKTVEIALHQLVYRLEGVLEQKEQAMGVFVDIEGAFSNTPFTAMT